MSARTVPIVLGLPWLRTHIPDIDWTNPSVERWSLFCHANCLRSAESEHKPPAAPTLNDICLEGVPPEYHDLRSVFSTDLAQTLPPHRPYDCTIDFLPNSALPSSCLYQVSQPEQEALREYISSSLATGIIRPSKSPLGAGFVFIEKKD